MVKILVDQKIPITFIIDTGSTLSFISKTTARKFYRRQTELTKVNIIQLDQTIIILDKSMTLDLEIENRTLTHIFYIYDNLKFEGLIGLDLLMKTELVIEKSHEQRSIASSVRTPIRLLKDEVILPFATTAIKFPHQTRGWRNIFKPIDNQSLKYKISIATQQIRTQNNFIIISLTNQTQSPIFLPKDLKILKGSKRKLITRFDCLTFFFFGF